MIYLQTIFLITNIRGKLSLWKKKKKKAKKGYLQFIYNL